MPREFLLERLGRIPTHALLPPMVDIKRRAQPRLIPIAQPRDPLCTPTPARRGVDIRVCDRARGRKAERDIVPHADGVDDRRLRLERHRPAQLARVIPLDWHVVDQDLARRRVEQPRHQFQHR